MVIMMIDNGTIVIEKTMKMPPTLLVTPPIKLLGEELTHLSELKVYPDSHSSQASLLQKEHLEQC